jgi:hypothetical protein
LKLLPLLLPLLLLLLLMLLLMLMLLMLLATHAFPSHPRSAGKPSDSFHRVKVLRHGEAAMLDRILRPHLDFPSLTIILDDTDVTLENGFGLVPSLLFVTVPQLKDRLDEARFLFWLK